MNEEDAKKAIDSLNGYQIEHKRLKVSLARPNCEETKNTNLYIRNIPLTYDEQQLNELFAQHGEVIQVRILRDQNTSFSRRIGFVIMATKQMAQQAIQHLDNSIPPNGGGTNEPVYVKYADEEGKKRHGPSNNMNMNNSNNNYHQNHHHNNNNHRQNNNNNYNNGGGNFNQHHLHHQQQQQFQNHFNNFANNHHHHNNSNNNNGSNFMFNQNQNGLSNLQQMNSLVNLGKIKNRANGHQNRFNPMSGMLQPNSQNNGVGIGIGMLSLKIFFYLIIYLQYASTVNSGLSVLWAHFKNLLILAGLNRKKRGFEAIDRSRQSICSGLNQKIKSLVSSLAPDQ